MFDFVGAISAAINLTGQLVTLADKAKDADAKNMLADLKLQLADIKTKLADLIDENTQLKAEVKRLQKKETAVTLKDGLYYTEAGDGPYCTTCYDADGKLIRVSEMASIAWRLGKWRCGVCKSHYGAQ